MCTKKEKKELFFSIFSRGLALNCFVKTAVLRLWLQLIMYATWNLTRDRWGSTITIGRRCPEMSRETASWSSAGRCPSPTSTSATPRTWTICARSSRPRNGVMSRWRASRRRRRRARRAPVKDAVRPPSTRLPARRPPPSPPYRALT